MYFHNHQPLIAVHLFLDVSIIKIFSGYPNPPDLKKFRYSVVKSGKWVFGGVFLSDGRKLAILIILPQLESYSLTKYRNKNMLSNFLTKYVFILGIIFARLAIFVTRLTCDIPLIAIYLFCISIHC